MLVVSRKKDESIQINDNIEVKILSITQNSVKLGITAPNEVKIIRTESKEKN